MYKPALKAGALFAALAVITGAFGAHALASKIPAAQISQLSVFETGVRYQFYHSFALLVTGILFSFCPDKTIKWATNFFIIGIILFCGSLYSMVLMSLSGLTLGPLGVITPIGGLFFILGWAALLSGLLKKNSKL